MHYKVLVTGDTKHDFNDILEPYSEHITVEPYIDPEYSHKTTVQMARQYFEDTTSSEKELVQRYYDDFNEYEIKFKEDGTSFREITYNPNAKWDFYMVGGRWKNSFIIKPDANPDDYVFSYSFEDGDYIYSDSAKKKAIDFSAMRNKYVSENMDLYDRINDIVGDDPNTVTSMSEYAKKHPEIPHNQLIKTIGKEPWVQKLMDHKYFILGQLSYLNKDRNAFKKELEEAPILTYHDLVNDKEWIERETTWSENSEEEAKRLKEWQRIVDKFVEEIDSDSWMTTVDIHI